MNYNILVNPTHPYQKEDFVGEKFVSTTNLRGVTLLVEEKTYEAYLLLKEYLKKHDIEIGLIDAFRSLEDQQAVWDLYLNKRGLEYTENYVARPGTSEHHTGLAIDIGFVKDGKICEDIEEWTKYPEIAQAIFPHLHEFGFILRYPKGKEDITGYQHEPWHYRYVGKALAKIIYEKQITLEEYTL